MNPNEVPWGANPFLRDPFPGYGEPRYGGTRGRSRPAGSGGKTFREQFFAGYFDPPKAEDDSDKIIDVFEPGEGEFLILNKQIEENYDIWYGLKAKMEKKAGYEFTVIDVNQGILISWKQQ